MTRVELSLFIEANYPISGRGGPRCAVYGVGINDSDYTSQPLVNGKKLRDPAYRAWESMLQRSCSDEFKLDHPTYADVTVCKEWHSFSAFRAWWLANYHDGWHLDKDILVVGNREYGPDACIYVPRLINAFINDCGAIRGEFPIGAGFHRASGKFDSKCHNHLTGKQRHLGLFSTPEEAHDAWLKCKLGFARDLKSLMDSVDRRIYPNVVTIINGLK